MEKHLKAVWIDRENKVLAFHPFENSQKFVKEEGRFWAAIFSLTQTGYRVM